MSKNTLYYGDNLEILRRYIPDESVDLIYLDPPFNSNQSYNVLFADKSGNRSEAQIRAFEDTWQWDQTASRAYHETVEAGGEVSRAMQAFRTVLGENDMLAYLSMMAPRLVELRRVLKPTGSIYLHCDPTASHYLKVLLDAVFGPRNFRNELVWKRTGAHSSAKRFGPVHDAILFYSKGPEYKWNKQHQNQDEYIKKRYTYKDDRGRAFYPVSLVAAGVRRGSSGKAWRGIDVTSQGNHWRYTVEKLDKLNTEGHIYWPPKGGKPRLKMYLDDAKGAFVQDWIADIPPINSQARERLGYPTQKPEALLERIIQASSDEGDIVLDPFCGCGTTIAAAQKLNRHWIGIDITHLAIGLIKHRLFDAFGKDIAFEVIGEPTAVGAARELAEQDPFQFQYWALGLVGARKSEQKKGADKGIDGRLYFHDNAKEGTKQIILSVKSGANVSVRDIRDLRGVLDREEAQIGVLITLHEATKPMRQEAASAGFYVSPWGKHAKIQILTIEELLGGSGIDAPMGRADVTFRHAPKHKRRVEQHGLPLVADPEADYEAE